MRKIIFSILFLLACSNAFAVYCINANSAYTALASANTTANLATEDISISFRFKADTCPDANLRVIFAKGLAPGFQSYLDVAGKIGFGLKGYIYEIVTTNTYRDNLWHHCAIVFDRDNATNIKIYIDGSSVSISKSGVLANVADSQSNASQFRIGNYSTISATRYFDGRIYDFKYWIGGVWTPTEIAYQNTHPLDVTASAGTITEYWLMQEGSGTDINAGVSTPTNDLVLSNTSAWDSFVTTQLKKIAGVAYADVKKVVGVAIASVKKVGGVQ
jgi:hypothetical protein